MKKQMVNNNTQAKAKVHYQISKYIDNELMIEQHTISIHPDSWVLVRQMFIDQGWHVTFNVI
jgi:hypothetical protein